MDNKNVILAVALSIVVLFGWNFLFPPEPPVQTAEQPAEQAQKHAAQQEASPEGAAPAAREKAAELPAFAPTPGQKVTVDTPLYRAVFNSHGGVLEKFELKKFKQTIEPDSALVDLVTMKSLAKAPMGLLLDGRPTWKEAEWSFAGEDLSLAAGEEGALSFVGELKGLRFERRLAFNGDGYLIDETLRLTNSGDKPVEVKTGFTMASAMLSAEDDKYNLTRVTFYDASGLEDESDVEDLAKGVSDANGVKWGAVESNYFMLAVSPLETATLGKALYEDGAYRVGVEKAGVSLDAGTTRDVGVDYYLGPKEIKDLENAPNNLAAAINYGWFDFVAAPLIKLLHFFYGYVHNYGVAIILLTVVIKLLFWPLSQKSYKSMEQMKKLQPMMAQIREKHKDDRQKMNEEMMRLYKTYKVNPAGGCLPMVVQIPVFIGLYQALLNAIELRHAVFIKYLPFTDMIWLADLSAKDPYYITPLIMGATMFLQQKMTPSPGDPTQAKIMLLMPVVFTFLFLNFPAGLVVYWLVNNVLSISQQWWMLRKSN